MGKFKLKKALKTLGTATILGPMAINGAITGIKSAKDIGSKLNDITGSSSAAKQSQQYALESARINNEYQKEFAQNAHQWEINDLQAAGLNPILSAGGSGASASGGGVSSATEQPAGISPIDIIKELAGTALTAETTAKTHAETENENADTELKKLQKLLDIKKYGLQEELTHKQIEQLDKAIELTIEEITQKRGGKITEYTGTDIYNAGKGLLPGGQKPVPSSGKDIAEFNNKSKEQQRKEIQEIKNRKKYIEHLKTKKKEGKLNFEDLIK